MKTRAAVLLSALALAACAFPERAARARVVAAKAPPQADARKWKEYAPEGQGFSVLMPGEPEHRTRQLTGGKGQTVTVHYHDLRTILAAYTVSTTDFGYTSDNPWMIKQELDGMANAAGRSANAEVLRVSEISLGEHPGRAVKLKFPDGAITRLRMYLVGPMLYQLVFTTPSEEGAPASAVKFNEETAAKFLDSFKLTAPRGQDSSVTPSPPSPAGPAQREGEVDRVMKELKAKNDPVYSLCTDLEKCQPTGGGEKAVIEVGKPLSKPAPAYPAIAKAAGAQSAVVVQVIVDGEGKVIAAQAVSGHPLLQQAAVKAAREARFTPTLIDGKPVKIAGVITYNFVLQ